MKIKNILIKNFRSIGSEGLVIEPEKITIISGANDTGKTASILASYAAFVLLTKKNDIWLKNSIYFEGSKHYSALGSSTDPEVQIAISLDDSEINKIIDRMENDLTLIDYTIVSLTRNYLSSENIIYDIPISDVMLNDWTKSNYLYNLSSFIDNITDKLPSHLMGDVDAKLGYKNSLDIHIKAVLEDSLINYQVIYISSSRTYEPDRYSHELTEQELKQLTIGAEISELVKFLQIIGTESGRRKNKLDKFIQYVRLIFNDVDSIEVNIPEGSRPRKDIFITWKDGTNKRYQPLSRSGSGIANSLYIAAKLLINENTSGVIFIDEPEIGLHPKLQGKLINLFRKLSKDFSVQWILSTHSPFLMKKLKEDDKLYLMKHNGARSSILPIEIDKMGIVYQAIGAYLPESLISKGLIITEGPTEVRVLTILFDKLGDSLDNMGVLIIPFGGNNLYHINVNDLKKINEKILIIMDSDLKDGESHGGNMEERKKTFEKQCIENDIDIYISREYRTLENIYPTRLLKRFLNCGEKYDNYDPIYVKDKIKLGIEVACAMTKDEAKDFPLVKKIYEWLNI